MLVNYMDELLVEWTGTKKELGKKGYTLIRERVTQSFQYEKKPVLAFQ